jgi:hypothetical protein
MSTEEALQADWEALCSDGAVVRKDLVKAWKKVKDRGE